MEFIVVTGISGAGKTQAMHFLEDIGFYCVDNIPPKLLATFYELCSNTKESISKVAVAIDIRGGDLFESLASELAMLKASSKEYKILFLDASNDVLIRRYKETRRQHPLVNSVGGSIELAIEKEKAMLVPIKELSDYTIDSSFLSNAQLKQQIMALFLSDKQQGLIVNVMSFGFKYGSAGEADLMFDVRCFPNPFYIPELKPKTGLDQDVKDYVMDSTQSVEFVKKLEDMVDFLLPLYRNEGKSQLVIAIGCTGGKHRSVTMAELLFKHLKDSGVPVRVHHRDICKN